MAVYGLLRPLLFGLHPETAHGLSLWAAGFAGRFGATRALVRSLFGPSATEPVEAMGLTFPNRIGLAAGYDKDGRAWRGLAAMGFGHVEVGTITPRPQPGNPQPRVFRLPEDRSLINRLGFPGEGADVVAARLGLDRPYNVVLGANLGKNKDTPNERALEDYISLTHAFAGLADYLVVNVSSPNTVGLRNLQARDALRELLEATLIARDEAHENGAPRRPLLVKLSPDLDDAQLDDALDVATGLALDGVIATNTTIARPSLQSPKGGEKGGLSGAALRDAATDVVAKIHRRTEGQLPIIGVGGIAEPDDVRAKLDAGATLVQLYTGLIYKGPSIVRQLMR
ncbi:MAG: quinone-dependent dihydroorotate dehydrogenase [Myxococcota bacterium]